jgi:hypothetical protein
MRSGQALIVVLLILAVLGTIGLSVMSRSRTEVIQSTVQEESARALEAAEVGLEKYLADVAPAAGVLTNVDSAGLAKFSLGPEVNMGNSSSYKIPYPLADGDVGTLDLTGFSADDGIQICWGTATETAVIPAMVATIYYINNTTGEVKMKSRGFDESGRFGWRNVTATSNTCGSTHAFRYAVTLRFNASGVPHIDIKNDVPGGGSPLFARVKLVMNGATAFPVGFVALGGSNFPLQAGQVESVGTSGDTVQKIKAVVPDYDMPAMFDNAIFSGSSLVK